jgi:DNA-nicking Smr family endonuclease
MNTESYPHTPVTIPIEDSLDLHTFRPREVSSLVEEYLRECQSRNIFEVRIIHGKGKGILRSQVLRVLSQLSMVAEFFDAPPECGHWGATIVRLHRS